MKRTKYISILIVMILIINIVSVKAGSFNITVTQNTDEYGSVNINWSSYNYKDKNFKVYKSVDGGVTYETVGIDYTSVKEVRCLQVYPISNASNQLKQWMETDGYGKGIIKVDSVHIDNFNINPDTYLKNNNGEWKYDVVLFGTWDSNNGKLLSATAYNAMCRYIEAGKGVILGHDTAAWVNNGGNTSGYFNELAKKYFGITGFTDDGKSTSIENGQFLASNVVKISKTGLLTNYPWKIGNLNDTFVIPHTHNSSQYANKATIWIQFETYWTNESERKDLKHPPGFGKYNFYIATYNNTAMIMTGDTSGKANANEEKFIANLIFYMNQLLFNECDLKDSSAQDLTAPQITKINGLVNKIQIEATDKGNTYKYYVESYDKNNTTTSGLLDRSEVKEVTVTTGVKGYRYLYSNKENETITNNGTYITTNEIPINRAYKYIHVAPVDGAGNIGNTVVYEINDYLITTNAGIGGIISNNHNVFKSESTSVFVSPMKGYEISNVVVDGVSVGKVETYNFINVDRNHTITATFNKTSNWTNELNKMNTKYNWINIL